MRGQDRSGQVQGASAAADRATHEQSPQAVSAVPVGIPSAWRAAKVALNALGSLVLLGCFIFGIFSAANYLAGGWGVGALWLLVVFGLFWFFAMLDQSRAQGIEARSDETPQEARLEEPDPEGDAS